MGLRPKKVGRWLGVLSCPGLQNIHLNRPSCLSLRCENTTFSNPKRKHCAISTSPEGRTQPWGGHRNYQQKQPLYHQSCVSQLKGCWWTAGIKRICKNYLKKVSQGVPFCISHPKVIWLEETPATRVKSAQGRGTRLLLKRTFGGLQQGRRSVISCSLKTPITRTHTWKLVFWI